MALTIKEFIDKHNSLSTLRFITCGSVDDGKSTLLGRMLYESKVVMEDQMSKLSGDSKKFGTQGEEIDFALLVDGLAAEREQGITIDIAYRYFTTNSRKFIVGDSPGHEEYTRNMATAASNADLAVILIDARQGVLEQTKRHSYIANMMGIKDLFVAINKMDLVDYRKEVFDQIKSSFKNEISSQLDFDTLKFIPLSALKGDNVVTSSKIMNWYEGEPLLKELEKVQISKVADEDKNFVLPVQYVNRPNLDFRGFSGTVSAGNLKIGDKVFHRASKEEIEVSEIFVADKKVNSCTKGDAVTITLNKEVDFSRGDLIYKKSINIEPTKLFNSSLIWFDKNEGYLNRSILIKTAHSTIPCKIIKIKHKVDINNFSKKQIKSIVMNDICECEIALDREAFIENFNRNKMLGSFVLINKESNLTIAAGRVNFPLRRSLNVKWEQLEVNRSARANLISQNPKVLWFTGLSGSGKSTIANLVEKKLHAKGLLTYLLDGDNLRHGLNSDLGFSVSERIENLRRVGEVVKILHDAGIIVLCSFISPLREDRKNIKELFPDEDFNELYVHANLETVIERDPKGLYKKANNNEIPNFTGISSPYEAPLKPNIFLDTEKYDAESLADKVIESIFS